jgi:eukaryotic-like serine/threonine-protein kinase
MIDLSHERWQRIDEVFAVVLELPRAEQETYLREACADDDALYRQVSRLLASDAHAERLLGDDIGSFLAPLAPELEAALRDDALPLPGGGWIGDYELLEEIGRGGMATIYLATREKDGVRQRIALKLVRRGIDTDDVLRRFRAERRILASLEHPNIARFYEAGSSADGRPYLVMEYIDGRPVTEHCDRRQLTIDERLELFRTVAGAVQHAHRQLVVHRDIKPSNVLVTEEGMVKLLDFGIAKLLSPDDDVQHSHTRTGVRVLTPDYAAPEQIRGELVSTATDVHGLGLLLYELLTGRRPYDLHGLSPAEAERLLLEHEPPPPSAVVDAGGGGSRVASARARGTTPERLRRRLRGDLDRIVSRALARDPEQRYAGAEQLAEDVARTLAGMPISARPPGPWYLASKFVRRHWRGVAAATAAVGLLAAFSVATTVQERRTERARETAERERETAERITSFVEELFAAPDPFTANVDRPDTLRLEAFLARGAERAHAELADEPVVQAGILRVIGGAFLSLRQYDRAVSMLEDALALLRSDATASPERIAEVLNTLGNLELARGRADEGERLHREALALRRANLGEEHSATLTSMGNVAAALQDQGRLDEADPLYERSLARLEATTARDSSVRADRLNAYAVLALRMGHPEDAAARAMEALEINRALLGTEHPRVARDINNLAMILRRTGRRHEAVGLFRESIAINRVALDDHPLVGIQMGSLANLLADLDSVVEARALFEAALERNRRQLSLADPALPGLLQDYAAFLHRLGDPGAEATYREALASRDAIGDSHPIIMKADAGLGSLLCEGGDHAEGKRLLEGAVRRLESGGPASQADLARARANLAACGGPSPDGSGPRP